jgi:hypothetical protein
MKKIIVLIGCFLMTVFFVGNVWGLSTQAIWNSALDQTNDRMRLKIEAYVNAASTNFLSNEAIANSIYDATARALTVSLSGATANGQIPIGRADTGALTLATLTAGSGVSITNSAGAVTIASSALYPANAGNGYLYIGATSGNFAAAPLTGTANQITVTNGANTITLSTPQGIATTSAPQFVRIGVGTAAHASTDLKLTNGALLDNQTASTLTITSPVETHVNTTSATFTTPIIAAIMGTTGGLNLKKGEATTGALSGASGSCAVNVPSGALIIGSQLRVDTLITSGDGGTTWGAIYATGATQTIAANTTAFTANTKVNKFFDANAATPITSGQTTITVAPNSGTFSGGVIRCITYYLDMTAMASL